MTLLLIEQEFILDALTIMCTKIKINDNLVDLKEETD